MNPGLPLAHRFAGLLLVALGTGCAAEPEGSVFLDQIATGSPLERAGFRRGDSMISWSRGDRSGSITGFDDLWTVEQEEAPRGPIVLTARRNGTRFVRSVPLDRWRTLARPALQPAELALLRRAERELAADRPDAAKASLEALRDRMRVPAKRVWVSWRIASLFPSDDAAQWERALVASREAGSPGLEAWVAGEVCSQQHRAGKLAEARANCEHALELRRALGQELTAAEIERRLASLASSRGDPREEEQLFRELLARLREVAPGSLPVVRALHGLAKARATQDDLEAAFRHAHQALAIANRRAPGGMDHQASLMTLGIFHWFAEEWETAETLLRQGLEILEAIDPDDEDVANVLNNLGIVAAARGDLASAERYYRRSLEARDRVAPSLLGSSRTLNNLANLAEIRGDYHSAVRNHREVLDLRRRLAPGSLDVTAPLLNLGGVLVELGELAEAERHLLQALRIQRRHIPGSRDVAMTLEALGRLELARDDLVEAEVHLLEAREVAAAVVPDSTVEAEILRTLAEARARQGVSEEAEALFSRSAELFELLAPDTLQAAVSHHSLGRHLLAVGRPHDALRAFRAAVEALDHQFLLLGGTDEVRARFRETWRQIYHDLSELLLEMGHESEAFEVSERGRARAFLFMMWARELSPQNDLSPALERERSETEAAYTAVRERLAERLAAGDQAAVGELLTDRRELQLRRDRLAEHALQATPHLAELTASLGIEEAHRALGDEVAALSYTVGERTSWLWVLGPGKGFQVFDLGIGEEEMRDLVVRFRLLLESPSPAAQPDRLAVHLYEKLIAPAESLIGPVEKLLIVPDGPLYHLPFSALMRPQAESREYLIAWKSLHVAPSLSAWDQLQRWRTGRARNTTAFADPELPVAALANRPGLQSGLPRLPGARREVHRIAGLFRPQAKALVGARATEAAAKRAGRGARYLHFANHAYVDPISPLDSALVLAPGAGTDGRREDGLLEAWEVLQHMSLDAELVTLSACETGGGIVVVDEGILGLTRAFQLAGARSVLASLWRVSDRSTAELMIRFYEGIVDGLSKDEALRQGQLTLLQQPDLSHPHHWAAFQLYGDWQ